MLEWFQRSRKAPSRPGIHNDWTPAVVILPVVRACHACKERRWGSYKYPQDPHQLWDCGVQRKLSSTHKTIFSNSDNCVAAKYVTAKPTAPLHLGTAFNTATLMPLDEHARKATQAKCLKLLPSNLLWPGGPVVGQLHESCLHLAQ